MATVQKSAGCDGPRKSVAQRSYPMPKVRGGNREHQAVKAQERPQGAIPRLRSGAVAERSYSTSKERRLHWRGRAERSYSRFKDRRADLVQGKEQWLHFAGAVVKRYPTSKVRETQVRW